MASFTLKGKKIDISSGNAQPYMSLDELPSSARSRPMKVLVLGMNRTGTTSMAAALTVLGFDSYRYKQSMERGHFPFWNQALREKIDGSGVSLSRTDFDKLLGDFDSVLDTPAIMFGDELIAAYPDAKVIITERPVEAWTSSMRRTLVPIFSWPSWQLLRYTDPQVAGAWYRHTRLIWGLFCNNDFSVDVLTRRYREWYQHIRKIVPEDRLLEYRIGDGWEPLCKFLDLDSPSEEYPHVMDTEMILDAHTRIWRVGVCNSLRNIALLGTFGYFGNLFAVRLFQRLKVKFDYVRFMTARSQM